MGKVVRVGGRGTSRRMAEDEGAKWAGEKYKEYQKKRKEAVGGAFVSTGRGTTKIKISDIPETKVPSAKGRYVSMGRGTGRRKVE